MAKKPALTLELARQINAIAREFPDELQISRLYIISSGTPSRLLGDKWYLFLGSLTKGQRVAITRSLKGFVLYHTELSGE